MMIVDGIEVVIVMVVEMREVRVEVVVLMLVVFLRVDHGFLVVLECRHPCFVVIINFLGVKISTVAILHYHYVGKC